MKKTNTHLRHELLYKTIGIRRPQGPFRMDYDILVLQDEYVLAISRIIDASS